MRWAHCLARHHRGYPHSKHPYLLQGETVSHDSPGSRTFAVQSDALLGQVAQVHLLLHVPQHSAVHLHALHAGEPLSGEVIKWQECLGMRRRP